MKNRIKIELPDITYVTCLNYECLHNQVHVADSFACNFKNITIDQNGKCEFFEPMKEKDLGES